MSTMPRRSPSGERPEEDDVVDAVQELRSEERAELLLEHVAQRLAPVGRFEELRVGLEQTLAADVARHDDDRVREVGRAPAPVGETPVVEHLEEQVEDVACAFSTSSKSSTLYGRRRTASVRKPPSSLST